MTYEQFKTDLVSVLSKQMPLDTKLEIHSVLKNNNLRLDGLLITNPSINISPTIYLNSYYERYQDGEDFDSIVNAILHLYKKYQVNTSINTEFFSDYAKVKPHLILKLIQQKQNETLLQDVPYIPFLDLAIVFCYYVDNHSSCEVLSDFSSATILIHNPHLTYWNVSAEELYQAALENTPKLLPGELAPLESMLKDSLPPSALDHFEDDAPYIPLYIMTNQEKFLGASTILYPDLLSNFATALDCDLIILPSSIHEVLLIPASVDKHPEHLTSLVQEVNETQLATDEVLSDHIYYYHKDTNEITYE